MEKKLNTLEDIQVSINMWKDAWYYYSSRKLKLKTWWDKVIDSMEWLTLKRLVIPNWVKMSAS